MPRLDLKGLGYKSCPNPPFSTADAFWQKRIREDGVTLYFIDVYEYEGSRIGNRDIPYMMEVKTQLYSKGSHEALNLEYLSGWEIEDIEKSIKTIYESGGFEPYDH